MASCWVQARRDKIAESDSPWELSYELALDFRTTGVIAHLLSKQAEAMGLSHTHDYSAF